MALFGRDSVSESQLRLWVRSFLWKRLLCSGFYLCPAHLGSCPVWGTEQRSDRSLSHSHRQLEQLEVKRSGLTKELVEVREALSCAVLQRDVLQTEKAEVAEALTKVSHVSH